MNKIRYIFAVLLLFWGVEGRSADNNIVVPDPDDSISADSDEPADSVDIENEAAGMEDLEEESESFSVFEPLTLSDEEYQRQLAKLPCVINLPYNPIVRNYIMLYTGRKVKNKAEEILGLSEYYFPIFEGILDTYGLPLEFKYLPVIESALKPHAVSRAGAVGLWQFMYNTAKLYDVVMTTTVDERRDPVASTHAAARHLRDLYDEFHDWTLVIAAYNCGQGNVKKAMRRSGKTDFWDIYYYLPRETRGYVPAFIGANYMMNYYKKHNLTPKKINFSSYYSYDTVQVVQWMHFDQIAAVTGIPVQILRDLNPQYRLDIIPGNEKPYSLKLPINTLNAYIDNEKRIAQYKSDVYNPVKMAAPSRSLAYVPYAPPAGANRIKHIVRSGETLGSIAGLYNVRINDLRAWNRVRRNTIYAGQSLNIYIKSRKKAAAPKQKQKSTDVQLITQDGYLYYEVKHGDTLWKIAQRYKYLGADMESIKSLNQLGEMRTLSSGQLLKIKKI